MVFMNCLEVTGVGVYKKCVKNDGSFLGYLEYINGSCLETCRTGLYDMSLMILFYPMEDTLKVSS